MHVERIKDNKNATDTDIWTSSKQKANCRRSKH